MPFPPMQLGALTIDAPAASVRIQAQLLAANNPDDPRIVILSQLLSVVRTHNDNARAAIAMFDELVQFEGREGYAYVRATLEELNQRNDVTRARLIKPYADFLSALDECISKGYVTRDEAEEVRAFNPGGLAADPVTLTIVLAAIVIALIGGIIAWNKSVPQSAADGARATATRKVADEALAILRNSGSTPAQQQTAKDIIEGIVSQPGGILAPASAGFGVGVLVAAGVLFMLTSRRKRSA